jgi:glycosyltransferase involved in cell wall biosynthesis
MNILIVSDAWHPQVNGVVRTLETTAQELRRMGHDVHVIGPMGDLWNTVPLPSYPSIKLELFPRARLARVVAEFKPDVIHIATEGPLGWAMRNLCLSECLPFTTSYHTAFPEYVAARVPRFLASLVRAFLYAALRRFHAPSSAVMVAAPSVAEELRRRNFRHLVRWSRGVDTGKFRPGGETPDAYAKLPRPILLYVGRVAVEKNLAAFLALPVPGSKVVIGDGPDEQALRRAWPEAHFLGPRRGEELARHYAAADLFVFPSKTDTFGLVLLEACASGLRIAAHPASGPADIFVPEQTSSFAVLDPVLERAVSRALALPPDPEAARAFAMTYSWEACTRQFYEHLQARTPPAIRRIARLRNWLAKSLQRWWQSALAMRAK